MKLLPVFVGLACSAIMTYYMPNCEIQVADLLKYDEPERLCVVNELFRSLVFVEIF